MTGYYDIVLGLIPASLIGLTALFVFGGLSLSASVPLASVATIGLMGHAMFVNAPGPSEPATSRPADSAAQTGVSAD
ncbi:uncharacterized protein NP_3800A [Natronomonas pharaonis DSM 2160]|uniref:Uncharacterized protein n=1 Tax=Natronomonas pharaonis (strain ATCC 35678 / DSM 2160 / CIP 103997 / JCM 8858 / NBRC 14720 / NCIMB 2260 / Gabara) TaxID=348780 RepID=A0A1U7EXS8_NATPD|nr:hypothetical protein [Natronomonas pharaonis]CAI49991.1 uncharacterized protein NP_3800A [Natronomonas pharaonis DSM 2160]